MEREREGENKREREMGVIFRQRQRIRCNVRFLKMETAPRGERAESRALSLFIYNALGKKEKKNCRKSADVPVVPMLMNVSNQQSSGTFLLPSQKAHA